MTILVCVDYEFTDYDFLRKSLDDIHSHEPITRVIHGAAPGANQLAGVWAKATNINVVECSDERMENGNASVAKRNSELLAMNPEMVVAFIREGNKSDLVLDAIASKIKVVQFWKK